MSANRKRNRTIRISQSLWDQLEEEVKVTGYSRADLAEKYIQEGILNDRTSRPVCMSEVSNQFNRLRYKLKYKNEPITLEDLDQLEREVNRLCW